MNATEYADVPPEVVAELRSVCLGLPEVVENQAWAGTQWRIRKRTFAHLLTVDFADGPVTVMTFRASGPDLDALRSAGHPFFRPAWGTDAVGMVVDAGVDWDEVAKLVTESYCSLAPKKLVERARRKPMPEATRHPALARLDAFVGEWEMAVAVGGQPLGGIARTAFVWLDGGAFLVQHADGEPDESLPDEWVANSPFPVTTIVGLDDSSGGYCQLYADGRGVCRVYQMSFDDGVWKVWRDAPGFFQRFTATFSADGNTITGGWEGSRDGSSWEPDFDMTYTKVG